MLASAIQYRVNNDIKATEVRVVDETGDNLGVKPLDEAIALAKEKGLDLIEIASQAKPPVARIFNFDKFRYQQDKENRKKQQGTKAKEMKSVRITPRAAKNDLEVKVKRAEKFLEDGHRVEVFLFMKGREKANKDWALKKLEEFLDMISVPHSKTMDPKYSGRGFTTQIVKT